MSYGSLFSCWKWEKRVLSRCSKHGATVLPIGIQPLAEVSCGSWHMVFWRARMLPPNPSYCCLQVCKAATNSELPLTQDGALSSALVLSFSSLSCGVLWHTPSTALDAQFYLFTFCLLLSFPLLNMNSKLAETLLSFINKYSPVRDCFSFNYIIP